MTILIENSTESLSLTSNLSQIDDSFGEHLTSFEWYFYVLNGLIGTLLNVAVLIIGLVHTDTHDKPSQVGIIFN